MRVHAGDTIKVEDIGTLGTVKKTDGKEIYIHQQTYQRKR